MIETIRRDIGADIRSLQSLKQSSSKIGEGIGRLPNGDGGPSRWSLVALGDDVVSLLNYTSMLAEDYGRMRAKITALVEVGKTQLPDAEAAE